MALLKFDVLSAKRLRDVLRYDPSNGNFIYHVRASQRTPARSVAGSVNPEGYRHIRIDGRTYKAHRLAWLYVYGVWPSDLIDHINGDRADNRIENLREATRSENIANSRVFRRGKKYPKGVRLRPQGFCARIQANKQSHFLGYFKSETEATAAYEVAARHFFGKYARVAS